MQDGSIIGSLLPLIVLFGIFYLLVILPQQRQNKKHKEMLGSLGKGDKVLTNGGIIGKIVRTEEDFFKVEIAENCIIKIQRESIAKKLGDEE